MTSPKKAADKIARDISNVQDEIGRKVSEILPLDVARDVHLALHEAKMTIMTEAESAPDPIHDISRGRKLPFDDATMTPRIGTPIDLNPIEDLFTPNLFRPMILPGPKPNLPGALAGNKRKWN